MRIIMSHRNPASLKQATEAYAAKLVAADDAALEDEGEQMIWLSAYAANNPRSDYHWKADFVYDECMRRGKPAIYDAAFKRASGR